MVTNKKKEIEISNRMYEEVFFVGSSTDIKSLEAFMEENESTSDVMIVSSHNKSKHEYRLHPNKKVMASKPTQADKDKYTTELNKLLTSISNTMGEIDTLESQDQIIDAVKVIQNREYGLLVNEVKTDEQQNELVNAVALMNDKGFFVNQTWSTNYNHMFITYGKMGNSKLSTIEKERFGMWTEKNELIEIVDADCKKLN